MNTKSLFFWWQSVTDIVWDPFWWIFLFAFILSVPFLRVWWWLFFPLMLLPQLKMLYLWWIQWDYDYAKHKWVVLEVTPPKEVLTPLKAMEDVFAVCWPIYDSANFREKWCDGEMAYSPFWFSFEMASIEGRIHYYLRFMRQHRGVVETALYAHYPDIEIREVPDYVKLVPKTVPNEEWDMYGEDYMFTGPHAYPIRSYEKFFEPQGERIQAEEKRLDPILSLLESMSKLGPGEHFWIQCVTNPVTDGDEPEWRKEGQKIINKIIKRPEKHVTSFSEDLMLVMRHLFLGPEKEGSGEGAKYKWAEAAVTESGEREMLLTPGERETLTEVENKLKKPVFKTSLRALYVAKRENWKSGNRTLFRSYVAHFTTDSNRFTWSNRTRPRVHYVWRKRRVFLRARKMFRMALLRLPTLFPDRRSELPILNTEELASLYHFPVRTSGMVAPSMEKVESKKAGPPPNLPVE